MRDIDRLTTERYGVPSLELMENAATAAALFIIDSCLGDSGKALIFCGKGNNGGDGAAVARLLATAGALVDVVLVGKVEEMRSDARINFERLLSWRKESELRSREAAIPAAGTINLFECDSESGWDQLVTTVLNAPHDVVVDALFGTGLRDPSKDCIERLLDIWVDCGTFVTHRHRFSHHLH
jgi:NAD(P)H-hydrate epimerase